jgi:anti-sigma regulatory factor (Ser/Thr protein kinase)
VREWDGKFILLLGDATGHGAPSALLTSAVFSAIECIQADITSKPHWWTRPDEILYKLNRVIISLSKDIMMTFVVGIYDPETNKVWLSNASHEAPVRYNLLTPPKTTKDINFLNCDPGPRLGDTPTPTYFVEEFQLNPMDRILFYTDGLVESLVEPGKNFSERFLLKRIIKMGDAPLDESFKMLIELPKDGHPNDDISFFMMDIKDLKKETKFPKEIFRNVNFTKSIKTNQLGFMVGSLRTNHLDDFKASLFIKWQNALIANEQRSRSQSFDDYISSFGSLRPTVKERLRFAIDELIMNGEIHGKSMGAVQIHLERDEFGFWIKSRDVGGNFKQEAAEKLYLSIFEEILTPSLRGRGAGIGLGMILKMAQHFHVYNVPSKETIVNCYIPDKTPDELSSFAYVNNSNGN